MNIQLLTRVASMVQGQQAETPIHSTVSVVEEQWQLHSHITNALATNKEFKKEFYERHTGLGQKFGLGEINPIGFRGLFNYFGFWPKDGRQESLGKYFRLLPAEIFDTILIDYLDLQSLSNLRYINHGFQQRLKHLPAFNEVILYGKHAVEAAFALKIAPSMTIRQLHTALTSPYCKVCGDFGASLYLLTCERVCNNCSRHSLRSFSIKVDYAEDMFAITLADMVKNGMPIAQAIPNKQGSWGMRYYYPMVVDWNSAKNFGIRTHGSWSRMIEVASSRMEKEIDKYQTENYVWRHVERSEEGPSLPPRVLGTASWSFLEKYSRQMAIVDFRCLNPTTKELERELSCSACCEIELRGAEKAEKTEEDLRKQHALYTEKSFLQHFIGCENAMKKGILDEKNKEEGYGKKTAVEKRLARWELRRHKEKWECSIFEGERFKESEMSNRWIHQHISNSRDRLFERMLQVLDRRILWS